MQSYFSVGKPRDLFEGAFAEYPEPCFHPKRARPPFFDLVYMCQGEWDVLLEGTPCSFLPGDVFLLPAYADYEGFRMCPPGTSTYYVHFYPSEADIPSARELPDDGIPRLPLGTVTRCQGNEIIPRLFEELTLLVLSRRPGREEEASALLDTLLYFLSQISVQSGARNQRLIENCLRMMKDAPGRFLTENEAAQASYVSVKTLRSAFVRRFGKTFCQYQMDSKLSRVCTSLRDRPDVKLGTLASELGFCDEFHLSKAFKRVFGISPSEYRRNIRKT